MTFWSWSKRVSNQANRCCDELFIKFKSEYQVLFPITGFHDQNILQLVKKLTSVNCCRSNKLVLLPCYHPIHPQGSLLHYRSMIACSQFPGRRQWNDYHLNIAKRKESMFFEVRIFGSFEQWDWRIWICMQFDADYFGIQVHQTKKTFKALEKKKRELNNKTEREGRIERGFIHVWIRVKKERERQKNLGI